MNTFTDFANSIGTRFRVVDNDGKSFKGLLGEHDVIMKVNSSTGEVEGSKFIAHFSCCRFIQQIPAGFKSVTNKTTHMDPNAKSAEAEQEEAKNEAASDVNTDTQKEEGSENKDAAEDDE